MNQKAGIRFPDSARNTAQSWFLSFKMSKFRRSINCEIQLKQNGSTYFLILFILFFIAAFSKSGADSFKSSRAVKSELREQPTESPLFEGSRVSHGEQKIDDNNYTITPQGIFSDNYSLTPVPVPYLYADTENIRRIRTGFTSRLKN